VTSAPADRSRRRFLGRSLALSALQPLLGTSAALAATDGDAAASGATAQPALGIGQRQSVTVLLEAFCPELGRIDGASAALVASIERLLAADDTAAAAGRRQLFLQGLSAVEDACRRRFAGPLGAVGVEDAARLFAELRSGAMDADAPLSAWSDDLIGHVLPAACLSGPAYARFEARLFWVLFA
jgi:hypothetical protein